MEPMKTNEKVMNMKMILAQESMRENMGKLFQCLNLKYWNSWRNIIRILSLLYPFFH